MRRRRGAANFSKSDLQMLPSSGLPTRDDLPSRIVFASIFTMESSTFVDLQNRHRTSAFVISLSVFDSQPRSAVFSRFSETTMLVDPLSNLLILSSTHLNAPTREGDITMHCDI